MWLTHPSTTRTGFVTAVTVCGLPLTRSQVSIPRRYDVWRDMLSCDDHRSSHAVGHWIPIGTWSVFFLYLFYLPTSAQDHPIALSGTSGEWDLLLSTASCPNPPLLSAPSRFQRSHEGIPHVHWLALVFSTFFNRSEKWHRNVFWGHLSEPRPLRYPVGTFCCISSHEYRTPLYEGFVDRKHKLACLSFTHRFLFSLAPQGNLS